MFSQGICVPAALATSNRFSEYLGVLRKRRAMNAVVHCSSVLCDSCVDLEDYHGATCAGVQQLYRGKKSCAMAASVMAIVLPPANLVLSALKTALPWWMRAFAPGVALAPRPARIS